MKILTLVLALLLYLKPVYSQLTEQFSDGDFLNNPAWTGGINDFIVNTGKQLQSTNVVANSSFYLSTANTLALTAGWEMYIELDFNPSSANYVDVYLVASASDLTAAGTTGYFIRVGNTEDEVSLYRKDVGNTPVKIIDGVNGILNNSSNKLKFIVTRDAANRFMLYTDVTGTGNNYSPEGSAVDAVYTTSQYFGILIKQSTASFFNRHFFDDISIKTFTPDLVPPTIENIAAVSATVVDVLFSESVDQSSAEDTRNYTVNNNTKPLSATRDPMNPRMVHLVFANPFIHGVVNQITIQNVKDYASNSISLATLSFMFYQLQRFNIVMDELMLDANPQVKLPDAQYIELRNTTKQVLNLQGCRIISGANASGPMPNISLLPDSFVVITSTIAAGSFAAYGRVIGLTGFATLNGSSGVVSLLSRENQVIHAVAYSNTWYQNSVKSTGGWSLEMIDPQNACSGSGNWKASTDARGGTPGTKNSVDGVNKDVQPPMIVRANSIDSLTVEILINEPIDSLSATTVANYITSDGIGSPVSASCTAPVFDRVILRLKTPLLREKVYTITVAGLPDCSGNMIMSPATTRVGLASVLAANDVVTNEVLFNPKTGGSDFVELYNRSNKVLDLKEMFIANRGSQNSLPGSVHAVQADSRLMFPGELIVVTDALNGIDQFFMVPHPENVLVIPSLPSYPDDNGWLVLLNKTGNVVDELNYNKNWHFELLDNLEGVSLERINYGKPTQDKNNWFSASASAGYGTPTQQNSQFMISASAQGTWVIAPKVFSPDHDGRDDFTLINYTMTEPGFVASVKVFDAGGRLIRVIAAQELLANTGSFRWDGLNDKQQKVASGAYIILAEVFNLQGKKQQYKNTVVVAGRF